MSWAWVKEIKNQTSYYKFNYLERGITDEDVAAGRVALSSYRGTVTNPNDLFLLIKNYLESLYQQEAQGTYNAVHDPDTVYEQFLYGKSGGTGMKMKLTRTDASPTVYAFANDCYRYLSFSSYNLILNSTGNTGYSNNYYNAFAGYGMIINTDTQEMYLVFIFGNMSYYQASHLPAYYDNAQIYMDIAYNNGNGNLWSIFHDSIPGGGGTAPYGDDDYTEPIGGLGDRDETTETVETSPIPVAAATRSGMVTAFVPTWGEIQDVADALLDPNIFQILASTVVRASDVIIGLSVFPCSIPANSVATVTANFLGINIGTGVVAHVADDQYVEIPCGDLQINEYWGNCLDYNPYTTISIFLPFCGMYELDADEVMGKTINVSYRIDIFSGACLATIKINGSVFYQYTGQCSSQIPLNSVSFDNFLSSMIDLGVATATGVGAVKGAAGTVAEAESSFDAAKSSEALSAFDDMMAAKDKYTKVKENSGVSILGATVNSVIGGKGFYSHAGAIGGSPGFLAVKKPFVIIKRPEQVIPSMYGKFHGYPSNTTAKLQDLVGYTEVSDIRLNIPDATVDEIIECEQLLKGGVVL